MNDSPPLEYNLLSEQQRAYVDGSYGEHALRIAVTVVEPAAYKVLTVSFQKFMFVFAA